jgi:hypothetical protein
VAGQRAFDAAPCFPRDDRLLPALTGSGQNREERGEGTLGICHLLRESLDALSESTQDAVQDIGARPQPSRRLGESLAGERSESERR